MNKCETRAAGRKLFLKRSKKSDKSDMKGLEYLSYEQRLQRLGMYSLEMI